MKQRRRIPMWLVTPIVGVAAVALVLVTSRPAPSAAPAIAQATPATQVPTLAPAPPTPTLIVAQACQTRTGSFAPCGEPGLQVGQVARAGQSDRYPFNGRQGQHLEVRMKRTSGTTLDPRVELIDPSGQREAFDDDSGGNKEALLEHVLRATGTYTIAAIGAGDTVGPYALTWSLDRVGRIQSGDTLKSELAEIGQKDRYQFEARQGQLIEARLTRDSGLSFDPQLTLVDPQGRTEASDNDGGGARNAFLEKSLAQTGTYTLIAGGGNTRGSYNLRVWMDRLAPIAAGQTISGRIDDPAQKDRFLLHAQEGERVEILMTRTAGTLDPELELLDPAGAREATDNDSGGSTSALIRQTLARSGTYVIVARAHLAPQTGTYTITVRAP